MKMNMLRAVRMAVKVCAVLALLFQSCFNLSVFGAEWVPGELLVKYKPGVSSVNVEQMNKTMGVTSVRILQAANRDWRVVKFDPLEDVQEKARAYMKSGLVQYVEPNYIVHTDAAQTNIPNDPAFKYDYVNIDCYSFEITDAIYAWDTITDASSIIVAVVDSGVNYNHEDLKDNMWVNPNPTVGDIHGIHIMRGVRAGDPMDDSGHGTHIAGIIGARGNNGLGTAGVAWKVQIMACKATTKYGNGVSTDIYECMAYAREHGARVINLSLGVGIGSPVPPEALREEIIACRNAGVLCVCSAGNDASNNDEFPLYPTNLCMEYDNVISVGNSTREDKINSDSCYGKNSVQLFAPGSFIYSTGLGYSLGGNSSYGEYSGTSMSAPFVAGAAALCMAAHPGETYREIRDRILNSVDPIPSMSEKCVTGGRINVNNLVNEPVLRIRTQPKTQVGIAGGMVIFNVWATGSNISYQWYKDGTVIHNATSSSYTIQNLKASDVGSYKVVVSDGKDFIESDIVGLSLCSPAVNASFVVEDLRYEILTLDGKKGTVAVSDNGAKGNLLIPGILNCGDYTFTVTELDVPSDEGGTYRFSYNGDITSVTIPDTVTYIGNSMFYKCFNMTELNIGNSVEVIGKHAFYSTDLTDVIIPASVTSIGSGAFVDCVNLTSVYFKGNAPEITDPSSVFYLADKSVIYYNKGMTGWTNPWCDRPTVEIEGVHILTQPQSQIVLENGTVTFSVTAIAPEPLSYQWYKDGFAINGATSSSYTIDNVQISDVGNYTVTINAGMYNVNSNKATLFVVVPTGDPAEDFTYTISGGKVTITGYVGANKVVNIPTVIEGCIVTTIGDRAFRESNLISVTIGNGVTSIGWCAFAGCDSLASITIPDSVTSIESEAFTRCNSLTSITIPDSVNYIADMAFYGCGSLTSITIPNGVNSIKDRTFSGCNSLTNIMIPDSVTSIESDAFSGCSSLTNIMIPDAVTSIGERAFNGCCSLTSITIPEGVTSIGDWMFSGCSGLTSITIPDSVTSIGNWVFCGCSGLMNITIPDSVIVIGDWVFCECSSLTSITIPDSVTSIGDGVFSECRSLTNITIPNGVTSIGERAFSGCSSLTSITIPDSVTSMRDRAFSYCYNLQKIYFYGNAPKVEVNTFGGSNNVIIYYCEGTTGWTNPWCGRQTVELTHAPSIRTQTKSKSVYVGDTVTLSVTAIGFGVLNYQWYKDDIAIIGATASNYTIEGADVNDEGSYTVTVSNEIDSMTSDEIVLTVKFHEALELLLDFQFNEGQGLTSISSVGDAILNLGNINNQIEWSVNAPARDVDLSITDDFSIYVDNQDTSTGIRNGTFNCDSIDFGDTSDASFTLEAWIKGASRSSLKQVFFQTWSSTTGRCPRLSFAIGADCTVCLTTLGVEDIYTNASIPEDGDWHHIACAFDQPNKKLYTYVDGELANERNLDNANVNFGTRSGTYENIGVIGSEYSGYAPFTGCLDRMRLWKGVLNQNQLDCNKLIVTKPTIRIRPKSQTVVEGDSVTFNVTATGTSPLSYQWYKDNKAITGAINSTYTIKKVNANDMGNYTVTVSNVAGSVTSKVAVLKVSKKLIVTLEDMTVMYGSEAVLPQAQITGLVEGDDVSYIVTTDYKIGSPVGEYTITATAGGKDLAIYTAPATVTSKLTVTPKKLTVTLADATVEYGKKVTLPKAKIKGLIEGDDVTYAVTTDYTVGSPVGEYTITATAGGMALGNYTAPATVTSKLTVTAKELTVTLADATVVYGKKATLPKAKITGLYDTDDVTYTVKTDYKAGNDVGEYTITATAGGTALSNYTAPKTVTSKLTVTRKPLTITAPSPSVTYGLDVPAMEPILDGIVGNDKVTATVTTAYTKGSKVGTYTTSIGEVTGAENYEVTKVDGKLTVTKAALTVKAEDKTVAYGKEAPAYTVIYSGFIAGDDASKLSGTLAFDCAYEAGSAVNTYSITPKGLTSGNYAITFAEGTLMVTAKKLTVTLADATVEYGKKVTLPKAKIKGLIEGDDVTYTVKTDYKAGSPVGEYTITATASGTALSNYTAPEKVTSKLTVTAKELTVTLADVTVGYGEEATLPKAEITGLYGKDDVTYTVTTDYKAGNKVGEYTITATASGTALSNYTAPEKVTSKLTVTAKELTVTLSDATVEYGKKVTLPKVEITGLYDTDDVTYTVKTDYKAGNDVGEYTITATAGGSALSNYTAPKTVTSTLTVTKKALTITAPTLSVTYGSDEPTMEPIIGKLIAGDTVTATVTTTYTKGAQAGTYTTSIGEVTGAENYEVTNVDGTLTVNKVDLIVKAEDKTVTYGDKAPEYTVTYSGFVAGDDPSKLSGTLAFDCAYEAGSAVNTYDITPKGLTSENYEIAYQPGTLTVTAKVLTITAPTMEVEYGSAVPELKAIIGEGVIAEDTVTATVTTTYNEGSKVGTYTTGIGEVTGAENYEVTKVDGELTVTAKALTVTLADVIVEYGKDASLPEVQITGLYETDDVTYTVTTDYKAGSKVGEYTITATAEGSALSNYTAPKTVTSKLTVTKADQTITLTVEPVALKVGESTQISAESTSGLDVTITISDESILSKSGEAISEGTVTITATQAGNENYNEAETVTQTVTVSAKDVLTVLIDNKTITYGEDAPEYTYTMEPEVEGVKVDLNCTYQPDADAGSYPITATVTGAEKYNVVVENGTLTVEKADPEVSIGTGEPEEVIQLNYGELITDEIANVQANVEGIFTYEVYEIEEDNNLVLLSIDPTETALDAGTYILKAIFTPEDAINYNEVTVEAWLIANQAEPEITWATPAAITEGTALSNVQLNATTDVEGTFEYDPSVGTVLEAGTHILTVLFTPDSANYTQATASVELVVEASIELEVTWEAPEPIDYGTPLSETQLNATANVEGQFIYDPALGTVLNAGTQKLTVVFKPEDTNLEDAYAEVELLVNKAEQTLTFEPIGEVKQGDVFTLSASTDMHLSVRFVSSDEEIVKIEGNIATVVGSGTVTITAIQDGNENYEAVSEEQTLTISGEEEIPEISYSIDAEKGTMTLRFTCKLYESEDGIAWILVEGAKDTYTVNIKQGKMKLYRAAK